MDFPSYYGKNRRTERRRRYIRRQILWFVRTGALIVLLASLLVIGSIFAAQMNEGSNSGFVDRSVDKNSMNTFGGSTYTYIIED